MMPNAYLGQADLRRADLLDGSISGGSLLNAKVDRADFKELNVAGTRAYDVDLSNVDGLGRYQLDSMKGGPGTLIPPHLKTM